MKNLSEKIGITKIKRPSRNSKMLFSKSERTDCDTMENNAFHVIGDDDL